MHLGAETTDRGFLDGDQDLVVAGELLDQGGVNRLGESGIGDGGREAAGGEFVGGLQRVGEAGAEREDGDVVALAQDDGLCPA